MNLSDKENVDKLIKACIKGDQKSQKLLYEAFYGKMLSVCMRYANDINQAKDILHDGFIKVFINLKKFKNKGSLEGWIRRIIVNNAIDNVRRKKLFFVDETDYNISETIDDENLLNEIQTTKIKAEIIIKLIQKLSPAYQTVFNMYVIDEYTHKEIAEKLNINIGTSKSNYFKAKKKLINYYLEYIKNNNIE